MAVADGGDPEAGGEIYIRGTVDVPDPCTLGLFPEERDGAGGGDERVDARRFDGRDPP
jgi:hypothetical protein